MTSASLLIFGLGYTGTATARDAVAAGCAVRATSRDPAAARPPDGVAVVPFDSARESIRWATHVLVTAAPGPAGDPVLAAYADALAESPPRWIGYLSTTGVYGDRGGGWVDEDTPPDPAADRARRRIDAEQGWAAFADRAAVDIFRVAGIYGPGRSAIDDVRAGRARSVFKPGHQFGRIHREDIAGAVMAAIGQERPPGLRILNLVDDVPAESAVVIEEAAALLGVPPPPRVPFEQAWPAMSEMARSFWADNRRVSGAKTQERLGRRWRYPSYREGLRAILAEEGLDGADKQGQIPGS